MKRSLIILQCWMAIFLLAGCKSGFSRSGYMKPAIQDAGNHPARPIALQANASFSADDVEVLGSISAYDTGFSVVCDEAYVLDRFCREGMQLGADVVNITQEKQPDVISTCYRAKAQFLRFKDRDKAKNLVSDAKYAPRLIIERSLRSDERTEATITAGVMGGSLAALIVWQAEAPKNP
jgi:hypothetical protein